ncbi:hypothetical protein K457DRAFT_25336 [Linnemannia elongata AG-77]|uniref:Uncharacterized protein n=1 Tax=Linnemannia elongata AG-77 TaxID=1314771 RepID=A0A197JDI5_9FUNG|nr:hypothetical protein K457DRAFT_25336 [Linnemannia elongata AG-77]
MAHWDRFITYSPAALSTMIMNKLGDHILLERLFMRNKYGDILGTIATSTTRQRRAFKMAYDTSKSGFQYMSGEMLRDSTAEPRDISKYTSNGPKAGVASSCIRDVDDCPTSDSHEGYVRWMKKPHSTLFTADYNILVPGTEYTVVAAGLADFRGNSYWHLVTQCGLKVKAGKSLEGIWERWRGQYRGNHGWVLIH